MSTLGLELGRGLVRVVVAEIKRGGLQLLEAATIPLQGDLADSLPAAVGGFLASHGKGVQKIVVGLPLRDAHVKLVQFPPTSEDNLGRLADAAAQNLLPLPPDQLRFDHAVVDPGDGGQATVVMAACRRQTVDELLGLLARVQVTPAAVDLAPLAVANVFAKEAHQLGAPLAILELGDEDVQLVILDGHGRLRQVRLIGSDPSLIVEEVQRSLQAYAGTEGQEVAEMRLVGPGAADGEAPLREALSLPVTVGDPWAGGGGGGFAGQGAVYAVASGLAMRAGEVPLAIDLKPRAEARTVGGSPPLALIGVAALFGVLLLGAGLFWHSYRTRQADAAAAAEQVERLEAQLQEVSGEDPEMVAALAETVRQVREDRNWLDLLRDISVELPGQIALNELVLDGNRPVVLRGESFTNTAIAQAMDRLLESDRFATVRLDYANAERVGEELLYNFQITCGWPAAEEVGR